MELWDPTCITGVLNIFPGCLVDIVWYGQPHLPFIDVLDIAGSPASSEKPCYSFAYLGSFAMFVKGSSSTSSDSLTRFPRAERRLGPPSCWDESRFFIFWMVHTSCTWRFFLGGSDLMHKFDWCKISEASRVEVPPPTITLDLTCAYFIILWQKYPPASCKVLMKCLNPLKPHKILFEFNQLVQPKNICVAFLQKLAVPNFLEIWWLKWGMFATLRSRWKGGATAMGGRDGGCSVETSRWMDLQNRNCVVFWIERNLGKDWVFLYLYRIL